jgi:hypothetical protein
MKCGKHPLAALGWGAFSFAAGSLILRILDFFER